MEEQGRPRGPLDPAVAVVRLAVRECLAAVPRSPGSAVVVACSGGADSTALLAATVFESRDAPWRVVVVSVDHGLQEGSARRAQDVADRSRALGAEGEVRTVAVDAGSKLGPEAAAREARYAALDAAADEHGASVVLLGHTLDDQAETVLLGLARGSGPRSLAGMAPASGRYRRPLLEVTREQTAAACQAEHLTTWADPHNDDPRFARVRVRTRVLPVLEAELGPGVAAALARTASLLRADADALDQLADLALAEARMDGGLRVPVLEVEATAVRDRVLRRAALEAGSPSGELFAVHVHALSRLVHRSREHRQVQLPGGVTGYRDGDLLRFRPTPAPVAG